MEIEILRENLCYEPQTGELRWKKSPSKAVPVGSIAGKRTTNRYARVQLNGKNYLAHRVCWALHYGSFPALGIDHINGDTFDNRIENLRSVSAFENCKNKRMHREGKSFGAHFIRGKWHSTLRVKGKTVHVGVFKTEAEAFACTYGYIKGANLTEHLEGVRNGDQIR